MTDRQIVLNTLLKNTEIVICFSSSVPVSALVFTGLSVPVCPWLCFSGGGRSLELFAAGSRTVVRGSRLLSGKPGARTSSQSHRTTGGEKA